MEGSIVEGYWLLRGVICKNLILPPMISVLVLFSFLFSLARLQFYVWEEQNACVAQALHCGSVTTILVFSFVIGAGFLSSLHPFISHLLHAHLQYL